MWIWMKSWLTQEQPGQAERPTVVKPRGTKLHRALVATVEQRCLPVILLTRTELVLGARQTLPGDDLEVRLCNSRSGAMCSSHVHVTRVQRGFDGAWHVRCVFERPLERTLLAALQA